MCRYSSVSSAGLMLNVFTSVGPGVNSDPLVIIHLRASAWLASLWSTLPSRRVILIERPARSHTLAGYKPGKNTLRLYHLQTANAEAHCIKVPYEINIRIKRPTYGSLHPILVLDRWYHIPWEFITSGTSSGK